jgi:hypothetical protein
MNTLKPRTVKPWRLSRRAVLRGLGVSLSLPLLEAMEPRLSRAQANVTKRFLCVYSPNGFLMNLWTPTGTGTTWTTPALLSSLEPYRGDFSIVTGLGNYPASIAQQFGGSHTRGCASLLTAAPIPDNGAEIQNDISLDQVIAENIGQTSKFPSIQVGSRQSSLTGNCEDQYSCAFNNNISWSGPTTPLNKQTNPRDIFDRLFGDGVSAPVPGAVDNSYLYQHSILDVVGDRTELLNQRVGMTDRLKLEEYLDAVRNVEQRIGLLVDGTVPPTQCTVGDPPPSTQDQELPFTEHLDLISDLVALAFQCDVTRVGTFMFEHSFSDTRSFDFLPGVTGRHHEITHSDAADQEELINRFYVERFAYLMGKLKAMPEGEGTVLDNSLIYFTSEFGNGHAHDFRNAAMLVAGSAGGRLKRGVHVAYPLAAGEGTGADGHGNPDDTQLAALHLTTLHAFDIPQASFGKDADGNPIATTTLSDLEA